MPAVVSALLCHAPIVVPAVAGVDPIDRTVVGARGAACAQSTAAMRAAARRVVERKPDVVIVLSPHTPRPRHAFSLIAGERIRGDFGKFGAPQERVDVPSSDDVRARIRAATLAQGLEVETLPSQSLDHGALVPLWFLVEAGWRGTTVIAGLPARGSRELNDSFGRALAAVCGATSERWAIIASGDCSHRLIEGAPAGFHADAQRFDAALARTITAGDDRALASIDPALRELAAEDVIDTVEIAAAATGYGRLGREVLSYEGPFGVGYLVAVLHDADARMSAAAEGEAHVLVDVARDALDAWHERRARRAFDTRTVDAQAHKGVFVTWRTVPPATARPGSDDDEHTLRGCVGRMSVEGTLSRAVADLAVSAASSDPRFPPIRHDERVAPEITLLAPSEPVSSLDELDIDIWGVEATLGSRHGVLLPAIDGVANVNAQVSIVLRKAGISPSEPYELRKFRARKVV